MLPEVPPYHLKVRDHFKGQTLEVVDRIIKAIADNPESEPCYRETARRFTLYTKIYSDRCAYVEQGDAEAVIGSWRDSEKESGESSIRSRALRLWQEQGEEAEPAIRELIEGRIDLQRLDCIEQATLYNLTRDVLAELLRPEWVRTANVLGLAQQYFPGSLWNDVEETGMRQRLIAVLGGANPNVHEYFSHLLVDFALADPSLDDLLREQALSFAREVRLSDVFEPILKKESQRLKSA